MHVASTGPWKATVDAAGDSLEEVLTCHLLYLVTLAGLLLPEVCFRYEPGCDTSERRLCGCALPLQWCSWCTKGSEKQYSRQLLVFAVPKTK